MAKLGDICTIQSGGTPSRSNKDYWDNGTIPWAKISDFSGKYLDHTSEKITQAGLDGSSTKIFPKGTILYTIFATLGETCILDIDATTNQAIAGLKLIDDSISLDYLYYYLLSKKEYVNEIGRGVAQNNINMKILREMEITIPQKEEQDKITNVLNKVYELIALRKEQLAKLDQLVKSRFIELFGAPETNPMGWKCITVQQAINEKIIDKPLDGNHGGKHPKTSDYVPEGVPFIMANNLVDGRVDMEHCAFITKKQADSLDKGFAKDGDVLITHKGTIGRTAVLHCTYPYIMLTPQVTYYRPIAGIIPEYLKAYFDTDYFQGIIGNIASVGSTRAYIGITAQQELPLLIPAMEKQKEYAAFVEQTNKSKLAIQQSLDKLELLKKSLMQEYFG